MSYDFWNIEYAMRILLMAKSFSNHGKLKCLLDNLDEKTDLSGYYIAQIEQTMLECIFEDTRLYEQTGTRFENGRYLDDRSTYVLRDPLLTRYDDLCRKLEMKKGITKVENQFARALESTVQQNMQFNSYCYDYRWVDSTRDSRGAKIVLMIFEEFDVYWDIPENLFSILDFCAEGIPRLEAALAEASEDKVIRLPIGPTPEKEAA